jgi:hypothetical protein
MDGGLQAGDHAMLDFLVGVVTAVAGSRTSITRTERDFRSTRLGLASLRCGSQAFAVDLLRLDLLHHVQAGNHPTERRIAAVERGRPRSTMKNELVALSRIVAARHRQRAAIVAACR